MNEQRHYRNPTSMAKFYATQAETWGLVCVVTAVANTLILVAMIGLIIMS